jgi:uncharacterized membrane protein YoaK (UPF0700 family)
MSETAAEQGGTRPAETVAGFIAAAALAVGVIAIYYEPVKLAVPALIVALIAVAIGGRFHRLASVAVAVITIGWVLGMIYAVIEGNPLW